VLTLVDRTSPYALTGAVFARERTALVEATTRLRHAAGNFYLNDKPTGAVVGQQPFGGARASGTDDKAGSALNLLRFTAARTIKETFVPPTDYRYPFLGPKADGAFAWSVDQGIEMGRPSRLDVSADKAGGQVTAVRVAGRAVLVSEGTLRLP
jgi:delta 1-pyrroline-5-carboxylate dehydrogenase